MGILSFIKDAGEKLFGAVSTTAKAAPAGAAPPVDVAALNKTAGDAIAAYIRTQGLNADNLQVSFDGASHTVTVSGQAADQATKEKILVAAGNVQHVDKVDDQLTPYRPPRPFRNFIRWLPATISGRSLPNTTATARRTT